MSQAMILLVAEALVRYGIPAAQKLVQMYYSAGVTQADWDQLFIHAKENANKFLERTKDVEFTPKLGE